MVDAIASGETGERHVAEHPWLRSHIVTGGKGLNGRQPVNDSSLAWVLLLWEML